MFYRQSATWLSFFFFCAVLGFELRASPWATPPALFCDGIFWDRVSQTICPGWLRTTILLISAYWVARITGMSHWHLASNILLFYRFCLCTYSFWEAVDSLSSYHLIKLFHTSQKEKIGWKEIWEGWKLEQLAWQTKSSIGLKGKKKWIGL
jgi:hypothetical protein